MSMLLDRVRKAILDTYIALHSVHIGSFLTASCGLTIMKVVVLVVVLDTLVKKLLAGPD